MHVFRAAKWQAAQVLRREAQDLGQALRQWVAEAEATKKEEAQHSKDGISKPVRVLYSTRHDVLSFIKAPKCMSLL